MLEYLSLSDIVASTALPIAISVGSLLAGMAANSAAFSFRLPSGGGKQTRIGLFLNRNKEAISGVYIAVAGMGALFIPMPLKAWYLALMVSPVLAFIAKEKGYLAGHIRNDDLRTVALFLIVALPFEEFASGNMEAHEVIAGKQFVFLVNDLPGLPSPTSGTEIMNRLRYLGHAGDTMFFYAPSDGSLSMTKLGDLSTVTLQHHPLKK